MLIKYPQLCDIELNIDDLRASADFLTEKNFLPNEILKNPKSLLVNRTTLSHRLAVLDECCFQKHKVVCLYDYTMILRKSISVLKLHDLIDKEVNVCQELLNLLDLQLKLPGSIDDDNNSLYTVRFVILKLYLKAKLNISSNIAVSEHLKHRSIKSIVKVIDILQNKLDFSEEFIVKNNNLLFTHHDNLSKLLIAVPAIADVPIREVIKMRPDIALLPVESIKSSLHLIKSFDIPEDRVVNFLDILKLPPDTIRDRLMQTCKETDLRVFWNNPKFLRLIFRKDAAMSRLEYIDKLKLKPSIQVLSGNLRGFRQYAREGTDTSKGVDVVFFLSNVFKKRCEDIKNSLRRHPQWCHVTVHSVKAVLVYLRYKKFTDEEIFENIYILLYPVPRIDRKLTPLVDGKKEKNGTQKISGTLLSMISNSQLLNLCLYYIEVEFNFSGDGVLWFEDIESENINSDAYPTTVSELQAPHKHANKILKE